MVLVPGLSVSLAVTAVSSDTALGGVRGSLLLANDGGVVCFVRWGVGVQVASLSDLPVLPGRSVVVSSGGSTHVAGVVGSGTTTLRVTGLLGSVGVGLPLDLVSGSVAAYGLRRLRRDYGGAACSVRRGSDNVVRDVGFAGDDFDLVGFSSFVGGGVGYVQRWYDQSGGIRDVFDLGFANQPQVVLGATPTGRVALGTPVNNGLTGSIPGVVIPFTLAAVVSRTGGLTSYVNILGFGGGANPPALFYLNSPGVALGNVGLDSISAVTTDNQFHSVIGVMNGASSSLTVDGVTTGGSLSNQPGSTQIFVPTYTTLIGLTCEAIYFAGALSAPNIAALYASQRSYWGTG